MSAYQVAADLVVLVHFGFVVFVILGGLLALRWPWIAWLHVPAAAWGAAIEFGGWICPLTPLENLLRGRAGEAAYTGDFIQHYIIGILYPEGLTRSTQIALGTFTLIVNVVVYGRLLSARSKDADKHRRPAARR